MKSILLVSVVMLGCGSDSNPDPDPVDCETDQTRQCTCSDGATGAQVCDNTNAWTSCSCTMSTFHHGDVCHAPDWDCGTGDLVCILDAPGDTQGICRLACSGPTDCAQDAATRLHFDLECCDVTNGSRVCGQQDNWPGATCS